MAERAQYQGTGKRKTSVARVILRPGDGATWFNGRTIEEYFPRATASSSSGPEPRVSRPTRTRPPPAHSVAALPIASTSSGVRSEPTTPRTPSVPK